MIYHNTIITQNAVYLENNSNSEARNLIKLISKNIFIELEENDQTLVENLYTL